MTEHRVQRSLGHRLAQVVVLISSLGLAAQAIAQPKTDARAEARKHFELGNALLTKGATEQALLEFRASRALFATRGNTQNMAIALQKLGRYDEAWETYTELLDKFPLPESERAQVEREIANLRELIGRLMVYAEPGATVNVDGRDRGQTPLAGPIVVTAGTSTVRIGKPGRSAFERRVQIIAGELLELRAELASGSEPDGTSEATERRTRDTQQAPEKPRKLPAASAEREREEGVVLQLASGPTLNFGLGGPLADQCGSGCRSPGVGLDVTGRGAWHFPSGIEPGVELGFTTLAKRYENRSDTIELPSEGQTAGHADDELRVRAFRLGVSIGYSRGDVWVLHVLLGAGALVTRVQDRRDGQYEIQTTEPPGAHVETVHTTQTRTGTYAYVEPDVFLAYRIGKHFEAGLGLGVMSSIALSAARYDPNAGVVISREEATFRPDELIGSPAFVLLPRVGVLGRL